VGGAQGIALEKLHALADWPSSDRFDELERAALAYADGLTRTPADVSDELFAKLRARFDDAQLVELTTAIAWENFRARFNRAFLVESDGLAEGAACLIPARAAPH
jgi:alkylhydroperoxidase family enzyme